MHSVWDGLLGRDFNLADTRRRIVEITSDVELQSKAKRDSKWMLPQVWLAESQAYATIFVYTDEVINNLIEAKGTSKSNPIDLDSDYLKMAGRVAQQRAAKASHRLAEQWKMESSHLKTDKTNLEIEQARDSEILKVGPVS